MLKILQYLIFGHVHKWKIIKEVRLDDYYGSQGTRYYLQCVHCGNVKNKDII